MRVAQVDSYNGSTVLGDVSVPHTPRGTISVLFQTFQMIATSWMEVNMEMRSYASPKWNEAYTTERAARLRQKCRYEQMNAEGMVTRRTERRSMQVHRTRRTKESIGRTLRNKTRRVERMDRQKSLVLKSIPTLTVLKFLEHGSNSLNSETTKHRQSYGRALRTYDNIATICVAVRTACGTSGYEHNDSVRSS